MRFRRLDTTELFALEKEFVQFLAVSGIEAADWEQFKISNPSFCEEKIEEFSDVVIGSVLIKAKYCEHRSKDSWMLFKCDEDKNHLICLQSETLNLLEPISAEQLEQMQIIRTSKEYQPNREDEIFRMMQQGCVITDGKFYESLG